MLERIAEEIARDGGWISFARYMELALHAPGLGYYAGGAQKFGAAGDFVTAPELGKLFGRTLARQLKEMLRAQGKVLDIGAGSGALGAPLLGELACEYSILETSAELRERQKQRLKNSVQWLSALPQRFRGVIIANEVVDAMPVYAVAWRAQGIMERGVAADGDKLSWKDRPASGALLEEAKKINPPVPYESEIGLPGQAWMRGIAESLEQGALLVIDYGLSGPALYYTTRTAGTPLGPFTPS